MPPINKYSMILATTIGNMLQEKIPVINPYLDIGIFFYYHWS